MNDIEKFNRKKDLRNATIRATLSQIPIFGSYFTELFNQIIPNYREKRFLAYIDILTTKLSRFEEKLIMSQFKNEEFVSLLEESFCHAIKATTEKRREYIASILANGLSSEENDYEQEKYMLSLLNEINDVEIILLQQEYKSRHVGGGYEFYQKHKDILSLDRVTLGDSKEKHEKAMIISNYKKHLNRLELFDETFSKPHLESSGEPEFDYDTGKIKTSGYKINSFGMFFLKYLGLTDDE